MCTILDSSEARTTLPLSYVLGKVNYLVQVSTEPKDKIRAQSASERLDVIRWILLRKSLESTTMQRKDEAYRQASQIKSIFLYEVEAPHRDRRSPEALCICQQTNLNLCLTFQYQCDSLTRLQLYFNLLSFKCSPPSIDRVVLNVC